tara:strand:+ start:1613 stop:2620 length:1008 start_codon:yes stop_codon:yes gene_type:complete
VTVQSPPVAPPTPQCSWIDQSEACSGLVYDAAGSASAAHCEERCCLDDTCQVWQFGAGLDGCSRGVPTTCATGLYGKLASGRRIGLDWGGDWGSGVFDGLELPPPSPRAPSVPASPSPPGVYDKSQWGTTEWIIMVCSVALAAMLLSIGGFAYFYCGPARQVLPNSFKPVDPLAQAAAQMAAPGWKPPRQAPRQGSLPKISLPALPAPRVRVPVRIDAPQVIHASQRAASWADMIDSTNDDAGGLHPDVVAGLGQSARKSFAGARRSGAALEPSGQVSAPQEPVALSPEPAALSPEPAAADPAAEAAAANGFIQERIRTPSRPQSGPGNRRPIPQ